MASVPAMPVLGGVVGAATSGVAVIIDMFAIDIFVATVFGVETPTSADALGVPGAVLSIAFASCIHKDSVHTFSVGIASHVRTCSRGHCRQHAPDTVVQGTRAGGARLSAVTKPLSSRQAASNCPQGIVFVTAAMCLCLYCGHLIAEDMAIRIRQMAEYPH